MFAYWNAKQKVNFSFIYLFLPLFKIGVIYCAHQFRNMLGTQQVTEMSIMWILSSEISSLMMWEFTVFT